MFDHYYCINLYYNTRRLNNYGEILISSDYNAIESMLAALLWQHMILNMVPGIDFVTTPEYLQAHNTFVTAHKIMDFCQLKYGCWYSTALVFM